MSYNLKAILNLFNGTNCNNKITQTSYDITCDYGVIIKNCYNSYFQNIFNETFLTNTCYNKTIYNKETSFYIKLIDEDINVFMIIILSITIFIFILILSYYFIKIEHLILVMVL